MLYGGFQPVDDRGKIRLNELEKMARALDMLLNIDGTGLQIDRTAGGLTQRQLAKLVGTTASVICRLEDADYEGHSLAMLNRIAAALNKRVKIEFVPAPRSRKSA